MADLTDIQAAQAIKIIGADSSGVETNPVDATVNGLKVDGSAVTQPVSAASLPLPSGASTSANQTTEITSLQLIDDLPHAQNATLSKGVPIMGQLDDTSTTAATEDAVAVARITAQRAVHVNLRNNAGTETATSGNPLRVDPTGTTTQPVSATSLPLPTGAATETTLGTRLADSTFTGRINTLGQKTMANSTPVVLASDQSTLPVSVASLPLPSGAATETTLAKLPLTQGSTTSGQSGVLEQAAVTTSAPSYTTGQTSPLSLNTSGGLRVDGSGVTQPVTVSTALPTGANVIGGVTQSGTWTVQQGSTPTAVANAWPVKITDGTNTAAVKASSTAAVATDPAEVVSLSPNSPLPTGSNNVGSITNITGTISLPTGASTSALQTTGNSSLASIDAGIPAALGAATTANSMPVNIASDQVVPISATALPLPTGAATSANQSTEITSLQLLDNPVGSVAAGTAGTNSFLTGGVFNTALPTLTNTQQVATQLDSSGRLIVSPLTNTSIVKAQLQDNAGAAITLGQKTSANSVPVVLPSDQTITISALPATGSKFSFGQVTTSASTQVSVASTAYTEQTTNAQRSIASASANDTAAGTGARTVRITYLDQTGAGPSTEIVTLNGTSFVNTVSTTICFIEKIEVVTVGSTGSNVGILTLKAATAGGGATIGTIAATINQTLWAHHYVPTGKTSYISGFNIGDNGSSAGQGGVFVLKIATPTTANTPEIQASDFINVPGAAPSFTRTYNSPIQVTGPARIRAYVTPSATSSYTSFASFDYIDN